MANSARLGLTASLCQDLLPGRCNNHDVVKCAAFYRSILSAVNDLADLGSEYTLQNPDIVCQIVRKLPVQVKDKWWETVHHIDGKTLTDKEKPAKFI